MITNCKRLVGCNRTHDPNIDYGLASGIFLWKGTVLSRIWPTICFFMFYASVIVMLPKSFEMTATYYDTTAITILGIILGTLLSIRTNAAYERYMEGCRCWSNVINDSRKFCRILLFGRTGHDTSHLVDNTEDNEVIIMARKRATQLLLSFSISANRHLKQDSQIFVSSRASGDLENGLMRFHELFQDDITLESENLPIAILNALESYLVNMLRCNTIDARQFGLLETVLGSLGDQYASMERIKGTPVPLPYLVHLRQVIVIFCFLLPLEVASRLKWWVIPIVGITVFTFEGIDSIGKEIEDPFGCDFNDLPLNRYCLQIKHEIDRLFSNKITNKINTIHNHGKNDDNMKLSSLSIKRNSLSSVSSRSSITELESNTRGDNDIHIDIENFISKFGSKDENDTIITSPSDFESNLLAYALSGNGL